ncbi:unnamed protein product [Symbiodinium sp. CCMP2592]|nr:unnamed protein product [Symbiodinium sp. CCMP2592]CAE7224576.1 unnamed protein product [Symbiodinium sp. CCMP2592]CAE7303353.1 unnamed protein product [Symbiodinium sp. CCMP2592]
MAKRLGRPCKKAKTTKKKTPEKKLGKASSLPGPLWGAWLDHVLAQGSTWLWVALVLSHCFCLRITEVLKLKARDFLWKKKCVHIAPLKRQKAVHKSMLSALVPFLKSLRSKGKAKKRYQKKGVRGVVAFFDTWKWPAKDTDYLFPSHRSDAKTEHRSKDTVTKSIGRLRLTFAPPAEVFVEAEKIRSHSGRHRAINDMKNANISQHVAMKFARISDVRTFLGYGELTDEQTGASLEKSVPLKSILQKMYVKSKKNPTVKKNSMKIMKKSMK